MGDKNAYLLFIYSKITGRGGMQGTDPQRIYGMGAEKAAIYQIITLENGHLRSLWSLLP